MTIVCIKQKVIIDSGLGYCPSVFMHTDGRTLHESQGYACRQHIIVCPSVDGHYASPYAINNLQSF